VEPGILSQGIGLSMKPELYKELLDNLYDGVYYVDQSKQITLWNKSAEKITGYSKDEVIGFHCSDNILRHINENGDELCIKGCPLARTLKDGKIREAYVFLHHRNGHRVPVSVRVAPIRDREENIIGAVEIFSENSRHMKMLNELAILKQEIYTDRLTRVGNRKFAEINLNRQMNELQTHDIQFGMLFFDIDHFKDINDTHGHIVGDQVLEMIAKTTLNILRSLDTLCRWGGDEFMVLLPNVDLQSLKIVGEKIRMFVERTWLETHGMKIWVTISIGGTMAVKQDSIETLTHRADAQMYQSKKKGRNKISIT
jgi:diguanylate cyclase (GGDEF)-like protein/PAS domain S-box-containing protein